MCVCVCAIVPFFLASLSLPGRISFIPMFHYCYRFCCVFFLSFLFFCRLKFSLPLLMLSCSIYIRVFVCFCSFLCRYSSCCCIMWHCTANIENCVSIYAFVATCLVCMLRATVSILNQFFLLNIRYIYIHINICIDMEKVIVQMLDHH